AGTHLDHLPQLRAAAAGAARGADRGRDRVGAVAGAGAPLGLVRSPRLLQRGVAADGTAGRKPALPLSPVAGLRCRRWRPPPPPPRSRTRPGESESAASSAGTCSSGTTPSP